MSLNIFIPEHLLLALCNAGPDAVIAKLMAKASHEHLALPMDMLICRYAGMPPNENAIAAITYLGETGEEVDEKLVSNHLLFADPVHLVLQRDSFSLSELVPLPLSLDETASLMASLNKHFQADGLKFIVTDSGRCYVRSAHPIVISTSHPALAINRDINAFLPQGVDAGRWRQLVNEIQMLLFTHPVNQAREAAGLPVCNSLWFWGEGRVPALQQSAIAQISTSTPLLNGLVRLGYLVTRDLPEMLRANDQDKPLWLFLNEEKALSDSAFYQFAAMLKSGRIHELQLHYGLGGQVLRSRLTRPDLWKFWRKAQPMASYFEA